MHGGGGEKAAGTIGGPGIDLAVEPELGAGIGHADLEIVHQLDERGDLAAGGAGAVEVADETDADGDFVEGFAGEVPALQLAGPAGANFDFAVAGVGAVANDEVVGEAVFHTA